MVKPVNNGNIANIRENREWTVLPENTRRYYRPFPGAWNGFHSGPVHSRVPGMDFIPGPVHSQVPGMDFIPVSSITGPRE